VPCEQAFHYKQTPTSPSIRVQDITLNACHHTHRQRSENGSAVVELGGDPRVHALQLDLCRLEDEHLHFVSSEREGVVQALEETHLHDPHLIDGVSEGIRNAGIGDGGGVVPELHGH